MNNTLMVILSLISVVIASILGTAIVILFYNVSLGGQVLIVSLFLFVICFIIQIFNIK